MVVNNNSEYTEEEKVEGQEEEKVEGGEENNLEVLPKIDEIENDGDKIENDGDDDDEDDETEEEVGEKKFTTNERLVVSYMVHTNPKHLTPVPEGDQTGEGFTKEEMVKIINNSDQKYCLVVHYYGMIELFHSVFVDGDTVFACTSRGDVDDQWTKFDLSQLLKPMKGLDSWDLFDQGQRVRKHRILTITDLTSLNDMEQVGQMVTTIQ